MLVTNTLSQLINIYWFGLIIKQCIRNINKAFGKANK